MTGHSETQQTTQDVTNALETCRQETPAETHVRPERARPGFNRYLFENLMSNVEEQIGYWNRKAERQECHINHNFAVWQGYGLNFESP